MCGRCILLLDDPHEGSGGIPHDPAQAGGVGGDRGAEQAGGLQFGEAVEQAGEALRPQHRRVAADDHHGAAGIGCTFVELLLDQRGGRRHGVACATLFLLEGKRHARQVGQGLLHEGRAVADDDDPVGHSGGGEGVEHPTHERLAGSLKAHLREIATHPRTAAGGHDNGDGRGGSDARRWGGHQYTLSFMMPSR